MIDCDSGEGCEDVMHSGCGKSEQRLYDTAEETKEELVMITEIG